MTDLDHIESLVGPLPKGREYEAFRNKLLAVAIRAKQDVFDLADAALAEAYAVIERLASAQDDPAYWRKLHERAEQAEAALAAAREEIDQRKRERNGMMRRVWQAEEFIRQHRLDVAFSAYLARYQPEEEK